MINYLKKFFDNVDAACRESEASYFFLVLSGIVCVLTGLLILFIILVKTFGGVGVALFFPMLAAIRIIYAGIFAK